MPKQAAIHWTAPANSDPTDQEVLFFAFLAANSGMPVSEIDKWAADVALERPGAEELKASWKPPKDGRWHSKMGVSSIFEPLARA